MKQRKIRSGLFEYFNFSTRERRGAALLSFIILLQVIFLTWLRMRETQFPPPDPQLIKAILALNAGHKNSQAEKIAVNHFALQHVPFDPNKMDSAIASAAGLSGKQSKVILNYLAKGGMFRTKGDFRKMYCIPEHQYRKLEPFLLLPDTIIHVEKKKHEPESVLIDIGISDSVTLMRLKGIGPVFASRIVKYREKLGGFYSKEQLLEVYGMKDSLYNALLPRIILKDTFPYRYIHLNSDTTSVLAAHPYIRWKIAGLIVAFRKQRPFTDVQDIKAIPLVTDEIFRKLAPYLKTD